jgi:hypothetical protein
LQSNKRKSYYATLGVASDADPEVIRAAFRALAKKYHPDAATKETAFTNARFREINEAHSVLSNSTTRAEYDCSFATTTSVDPDIQTPRDDPGFEVPKKPSGVIDKVQYGAAALLVFGVGGFIILLIILMGVGLTVDALRHR